MVSPFGLYAVERSKSLNGLSGTRHALDSSVFSVTVSSDPHVPSPYMTTIEVRGYAVTLAPSVEPLS